MATRIHVVAARNLTSEQLRARFEEAFGRERFEGADIQEAGGWVFFLGSVWTVAGEDLDEVLQTLPGPSLRITSEDASRWYLLLFAQDQEPFVLCHEFALIGATQSEDAEAYERAMDFLREDDEEPSRPFDDLAEDFESVGCPLPEEVKQRLRLLGYEEAVEGLFHWQAETLIEALGRFEIPHDPEEVRTVLTGENVTEAELDGDLGNLARFLMSIGMGDHFVQWLPSAENEGDHDGEFSVEEEEEEVQEDDAHCEIDDDTDEITPVL
ncbi:MAG: hypothetical protein ACYTG0_37155, partial [Planctomycetota bacterium]